MILECLNCKKELDINDLFYCADLCVMCYNKLKQKDIDDNFGKFNE